MGFCCFLVFVLFFVCSLIEMYFRFFPKFSGSNNMCLEKAGEMTQRVKSWLCKHENLRPDPQHPHKKDELNKMCL